MTMNNRTWFIFMIWVYPVIGTDYLIAIHQKRCDTKVPVVHAVVDGTGGLLHYTSPYYDFMTYINIQSWDKGQILVDERLWTTHEVEYKGILIRSSNNEAYVSVESQFSSFAPLPTTALGTKYIVSSCYQNQYNSLLVIAAFNQTTSISIIARYSIFGPRNKHKTMRVIELKQFQTFSFEYDSDLTGTIITSTHPVAVFSGIANSTFVTAYEQLLPVRLYDKEYVVAVDDNPSMYDLQILSEQNGTVMTFNNGSSLTVNSNLYQSHLTSEETFFFKSSNPVMVTICRRNEERSGFIVVPPVSLYSMKNVRLGNTINYIFILQEETLINSSHIRWTHIPYSGYKTGITSRQMTTIVHGCSLLFNATYMSTSGITYRQEYPFQVKNSYLVAMSSWTKFRVNFQLSCSQGTLYQVVFPHRNQSYIRQITATISDLFVIEEDMQVQAGIENKAIRVDVESENSRLSIGEYDIYDGWNICLLGIFPITLLGREYIIQTCHGNKESDCQLVIVSMSINTDINVLLSHSLTYDDIEYKRGDTIRVSLKPYQTLTINSSVALCGTSVSASHNVAVFTLSRFGNTTTDYNQLLPISQYGQEYNVVANDRGPFQYVSSFGRFHNYSSQYYILVTSATDLTQIRFSDDFEVTIEDRISYRKDLQGYQSLHISSTNPVMVSLCKDVSIIFKTGQVHQYGCSVIIPTRLYTTESMFDLAGYAIIKIVSESRTVGVILTQSARNRYDSGYWNISEIITWKTCTHFNIGTVELFGTGSVLISSHEKFTTITVINYDPYFILGQYYHNFVLSMINPVGWNLEPGNLAKDHNVITTASLVSETDGKSGDKTTVAWIDNTDAADVCVQDGHVNIIAVAIGTTLTALILFLIAVIICHQIYIRRKIGEGEGEKTEGRTEETEASFNQNQRHRQDSQAFSTPVGPYSELHTEPQVTNTYESINQSFKTETQDEYENVESKF